jgi:hypothetical protein
MIEKFWTPGRRAWLYGVATALVPVLTAYGLVTPDMGGTWLMVVAALLSMGSSTLALQNVPSAEAPE